MRISTCPAPHSSPGGLRLCSSAFARWCTATGCIRSRLPSVLQVHTDQHYQALHSALRAPFAQQCFRAATQQPAFAAGCSRAASLQLHLPLFTSMCRTPPCGLLLHSIAAPPDARTLPAIRIRARLYHNRSGLHSQSAAAQHLPCTALQPWRASFVQQVLSPVGARQQAASAAGCLLYCKSGSTSNSIPISITRRCTPPCGLHLRSNAFAQQRNSPHSLPVALVQQVCSCICRSLLPGAAHQP